MALTSKRSLTFSSWVRTMSTTKIAMIFFVVPFLASYAASGVAAQVSSGKSLGSATLSVMEPTAAVPYPTGDYLRLSYIPDISMLQYAGSKVGLFVNSDIVPAPTPSTLAGEETAQVVHAVSPESTTSHEVDSGNPSLDTWVSETKGYMAAKTFLTRYYRISSPDTPEGKEYDRVTFSEGPFLAGDIILERNNPTHVPGDETTYLVLRGNRKIQFSSQSAPPWIDKLYEYPAVPHPMMEEGLSGPSAGLVYAIQYLDGMTEGELLAGHTVAFTGVVDERTGNVGAVGGLDKKIEAAREAGAEIVFLPAVNALEDPSFEQTPGIQVAPVANIADAVAELCITYRSADQLCSTDVIP